MEHRRSAWLLATAIFKHVVRDVLLVCCALLYSTLSKLSEDCEEEQG